MLRLPGVSLFVVPIECRHVTLKVLLQLVKGAHGLIKGSKEQRNKRGWKLSRHWDVQVWLQVLKEAHSLPVDDQALHTVFLSDDVGWPHVITGDILTPCMKTQAIRDHDVKPVKKHTWKNFYGVLWQVELFTLSVLSLQSSRPSVGCL